MSFGPIVERSDEGTHRYTHDAADDESLGDAVHGRLLSGPIALPIGSPGCHDHYTPPQHQIDIYLYIAETFFKDWQGTYLTE
jgi:hypothetical protein